ncbi:MAG TPA: amidohydrolase family protein, partial [Gemmatimonadaceae bacterium]|nr:amidohydrolase family protein [Gemmatimonadaceae bacterium]
MKNKLIILALMVLILGGAAGIHYRIPIIVAGVCVGVALFAGVSGLRMVVTRTAVIATSDSLDATREYHTGLSAQLYGVLFLMLSVPLAAFGAEYVKKRNVLTLEDAVRKMTSWPATRMRLPNRGLIKEGHWADVTIFDLEKLDDRATYDEPMVFPTGIEYVLVNGV